ncbi:MAG TPA: methionine ABC transporter ATP-binding protein [Clostridia bacterium]|nr:methionine ABC transporter ATP-binding protein [Clostridia bacterium]
MIELRHVSKSFGTGTRSVDAVRDVSLSIGQGEIFGIIGFSGAGKSTLVRCINLLERPTSGQVLVAGQELTALPERRLRAARKKIGMIFQLFNLMKSRTVFSNVAYPLRGMGLSRAQKREKVMRLLKLVGLEEKEKAYPSQLSGGQKQRVAIARALANDPDVLLCDEATSALDPQTTQDILKLLRELNRRLGITIVLITHEMAVVKEICTRVAVMEEGKVVEENAIYEIFADPKREITRKFIRTTSNLAHMEEMIGGNDEKLGLRPKDLVVRFECRGDSTGQALVSYLSRQYALDINIVFGNVEMLQGTPLGTLMVSFRGDESRIEQALAYLKQMDVGVEVVRRV